MQQYHNKVIKHVQDCDVRWGRYHRLRHDANLVGQSGQPLLQCKAIVKSARLHLSDQSGIPGSLYLCHSHKRAWCVQVGTDIVDCKHDSVVKQGELDLMVV